MGRNLRHRHARLARIGAAALVIGAAAAVADYSPASAVAGIELDMSVSRIDVNGNGVWDAGDTFEYGFVITNTGTDPATDTIFAPISVNAGALGTFICPPLPLFIGGQLQCTTANYTVTEADETAGVVTHSATATATAGQSTVQGSDSVTTQITGPTTTTTSTTTTSTTSTTSTSVPPSTTAVGATTAAPTSAPASEPTTTASGGAGPTTVVPTTTASAAELPRTGATAGPAAVLAGALVAIGAALSLEGMRRARR